MKATWFPCYTRLLRSQLSSSKPYTHTVQDGIRPDERWWCHRCVRLWNWTRIIYILTSMNCLILWVRRELGGVFLIPKGSQLGAFIDSEQTIDTSITQGLEAIRILDHEKYGSRIILVETPGFSHSSKTEGIFFFFARTKWWRVCVFFRNLRFITGCHVCITNSKKNTRPGGCKEVHPFPSLAEHEETERFAACFGAKYWGL